MLNVYFASSKVGSYYAFHCRSFCRSEYVNIHNPTLRNTSKLSFCRFLFLHRGFEFIIVYAHGRRLCSDRFRHGSTTISYPQCSLTFLRQRCLNRCREQSFAIRAYAMSAVGIDVVSSHTKYCRIAYGITREQNTLQCTNE